MIESRLKDFFRSPAGIFLTIAIIMVVALGVLFFTWSIFQNLLTPKPFIFE